MPEWIIALLGAVIGSFTTGVVQYLFWQRQHRQELQSSDERELRRGKARAAERLREIAVLLIELARSPVDGAHVEKTQTTTTTYIEILRLQRELVNAIIAAREAFPGQERSLTVFQKTLAGKALVGSSPDSIKLLRDELDALLAELRNV